MAEMQKLAHSVVAKMIQASKA